MVMKWTAGRVRMMSTTAVSWHRRTPRRRGSTSRRWRRSGRRTRPDAGVVGERRCTLDHVAGVHAQVGNDADLDEVGRSNGGDELEQQLQADVAELLGVELDAETLPGTE